MIQADRPRRRFRQHQRPSRIRLHSAMHWSQIARPVPEGPAIRCPTASRSLPQNEQRVGTITPGGAGDFTATDTPLARWRSIASCAASSVANSSTTSPDGYCPRTTHVTAHSPVTCYPKPRYIAGIKRSELLDRSRFVTLPTHHRGAPPNRGPIIWPPTADRAAVPQSRLVRRSRLVPRTPVGGAPRMAGSGRELLGSAAHVRGDRAAVRRRAHARSARRGGRRDGLARGRSRRAPQKGRRPARTPGRAARSALTNGRHRKGSLGEEPRKSACLA